MRLMLCGGRHFEDVQVIQQELARLHAEQPVTVLIHGSASGLGAAAEAWARRNDIHIVRYPPNWELHGKKAESMRNAFMIQDSRPDLVLAFPGGRHTADLVRRAGAANIAVVSAAPLAETGQAAEDESEGDSIEDRWRSLLLPANTRDGFGVDATKPSRLRKKW